MATSFPACIKLQYGLDTHKVELGEDWQVKDLKQHIWDSLSIPVDRQKIIYKGKLLSDPDVSIQSLNFKPKTKLMLVGEPVVVSGEHEKLLLDISDQLIQQCAKYADVCDTVEGVMGEFLPKHLHTSANIEHLKSLRVISGQCMNMVERLDSIQVSAKDTAFKDKKKSLITRINELLDDIDNLTNQLKPPQSDN
ncbi:BAG family molecular chaperone regulator 1 [Oopsacas minuta]|uniref:BAG family molecular chaperone regulator 1 n=1 Tax=Oopsacas minuta TaxID=111878 RepID=A0AAV7JIC6_9METZ|nr:BAG family molecular chaperone regulator 1 [Oopsacas minuta]